MKPLVLKYQYFANLLKGQLFLNIAQFIPCERKWFFLETSDGEYLFREMKERY